MSQEEEKDINETAAASLPQEPRKEWRLRINYRLITQNLSFLLFLAFVALVYIANSHLAEKKVRRINKLSREIRELKWEYLSVKSELMFRSKLSEVSKAVEPLGLKELNTPPQRIEVKQTEQ
ncbi:FtsL-like putative cell division protein [Chitinophaga sp. XS-30]|uniref:FtsL-like putative cell division protein n=1 Tax=Chitinophaga sp. XS-30 TaxID=2604421 RepID=UPI001FEDCF34|nr:FtsL-like putative cell division protein [Chitinophaga sp. XS-30]